MITYRGFFDKFDVWQSTFGKPTKDGNDLLVPAIELWLSGDHPLVQYGQIATGIMRFRRVISSKREVSPYVGDSFGPTVVVDDGPFNLTRKDICESGYFIEGTITEPHGGVGEWIIKADDFEFECEGVYDLKLIPGGCEYLNYRTIEDAIKQASAG
ncbi:MAG: hypothetical protein ACR2PX_21000 [Endozoicomonas sp.]|uniref:hypothetical protein n=1 Tax=Endozoicomonas sp. TaxID=1892382 RepID=UPI003D9BA096